MLLACAYAGGHPDCPTALPRAELAVSGLDLVLVRLEYERSGATMGLVLPSKKQPRTTVLTILSAELIALEADQSKAGLAFAVGGLVGVTEDFDAGLGGIVRTEGEGTLTLLVERNHERFIVAFTGPTGDVIGFAYSYQIARVKSGKGPLPELLDVDAVLAAERQARVQEEILASLRELLASR